MSEYDTSSIQVLEGLEPVRKRPGMYVGDVRDGSGLHHMLWEVLSNAIDEHLAGHASRVLVQLRGTAVTVDDNGRGIKPTSQRPGRSVMELACTTLHCGGTFDGHTPHVHLGRSWHGVGLACANALSASFEIESHRDGQRYRLRCERGKALSELEHLGATGRSGTRVTFTPDASIFERVQFDAGAIRQKLWELACLNPALTIDFEHDGGSESLHCPGGLTDMVRAISHARDGSALPTHPVRILGAHDDIQVEVALQWVEAGRPTIAGYVSQQPAKAGTHIQGFWNGLLDSWSEAQHTRAAHHSLKEVLGQGLVAAVHVGLYEPRFEAPTRDWLANREASRAVRAVMHRALTPLFERSAPLGKALSERFFFTLE